MRISVTTIEAYRLFLMPSQTFMTEEELMASIRGEFHPTPKMMLGTAFGRCLEKPGKYRTDFGGYLVRLKVGEDWVEYRFDDKMMDPCLAEFDRRGVFEAKATKQYGNVTVVAKADQIIGTEIIENKATEGAFFFDKYAESYQWRFMLDLFEGATSVTYKVFLIGKDRRGNYRLREDGIQTQRFFPYPGLHQDCRDLLRDFCEYVEARGLADGLREAAAKWGEGGRSVRNGQQATSPEAAQQERA